MLLVKTKIKVSGTHGIGLFADQFIQKGTITWKYHPKFDTGFSEKELEEMSVPARKIFLWYAYYDYEKKIYILCFDDQRFINHSKDNNNIISTPDMDVAGRDIEEGEELLADYSDFDQGYWERIGIDKEKLKN